MDKTDPATEGFELVTESEAADLRARLDTAERACLLFGWTAARHESDRDKAAHELWGEWWDKYGPDAQERHGADLSDEHIEQLARKRDDTRARTLARFGLLET